MKSSILSLVVLVFMSSTINAQFNTGSKMVGASSSLDFGFLSEKEKGVDAASHITTIDITPRAAYFVQNRMAVGGDIGYNYYRSKYDDGDPYSITDVFIGPFARYYLKSIAWIRPFGEVKTGFGASITKSNINGEVSKTKYGIFYAGAGVGAAFFLADNFALEGMLDYTYEHRNNKESEVIYNNHGIMLSFGFSFFFNSLSQEQ